MALAVEADLVAGCRHLGSDGGPPLDLLSNQEERRRYLGVVQNLQCGHRSLWVGAVVESQRDTFLAAEARRYAKPDCQGRENRHESGHRMECDAAHDDSGSKARRQDSTMAWSSSVGLRP